MAVRFMSEAVLSEASKYFPEARLKKNYADTIALLRNSADEAAERMSAVAARLLSVTNVLLTLHPVNDEELYNEMAERLAVLKKEQLMAAKVHRSAKQSYEHYLKNNSNSEDGDCR